MTDLLSSAVAVGLKILLPGWAWLWLLPDDAEDTTSRAGRWLSAGAGALALGVALTSLLAMGLGVAGVYSPLGEGIGRTVLVLCGAAVGALRFRPRFVRRLTAVAPVSILFLLGIAVILALPRRGEWIVGGWDPGVYVNEAAALSRTGTFTPPDDFFYDELTVDEQAVFLRKGPAGTERFPGVLGDPDRRAFGFELFRLTPSLFAAIHRSGGIDALMRANTIVALAALLVFAALLWTRLGPAHALFAVPLMAAQPLWLYHAHFPVSEMLQLVLWLSCLWMVTGPPVGGRGAAAAALFIFAIILNRFSDLPFAALLLLALALTAVADGRRRGVALRHSVLLLAGVAAAGIDIRLASASIAKWTDMGLILSFTLVAAVLAVAVVALGSSGRVRHGVTRTPPAVWSVLAGLLVVFVTVSWLGRGAFDGPSNADNLSRLLSFSGRLPALAAALGLVAAMAARPRMRPAVLVPLLLFLFAVSWMLVLRKSIVDWYPWATRRYLPHFVPFVAAAAGHGLVRLWTLPVGKPAAKALACAGLAALLLAPAGIARRAWTYTQYNGSVARLAEAAAQIESRDRVITDHPLWGTPLAMIHGAAVLSGLADRSPAANGAAIAAILPGLDRLRRDGRRIRCLTSTESGIAVFPFDPSWVKLDWEGEAWSPQVLVQHSKARQFQLRTRETRFRLYTIEIPGGAGGLSEPAVSSDR